MTFSFFLFVLLARTLWTFFFLIYLELINFLNKFISHTWPLFMLWETDVVCVCTQSYIHYYLLKWFSYWQYANLISGKIFVKQFGKQIVLFSRFWAYDGQAEKSRKHRNCIVLRSGWCRLIKLGQFLHDLCRFLIWADRVFGNCFCLFVIIHKYMWPCTGKGPLSSHGSKSN